MHRILFHKEVFKDLKGISGEQIKLIKIAIDEKLGLRPYDFKSLSGKRYKGLYRLRISDFRVMYRILDEEYSVIVLAIGHRWEIYEILGRKFG